MVGSNTIGNVPLVVMLLQMLPTPSPGLLYFLAVVSTLAGNLLIVGSLANIITVERAQEVGVQLGFFEHAKMRHTDHRAVAGGGAGLAGLGGALERLDSPARGRREPRAATARQ